MKKITNYLLLFILLFIPFGVYANTETPIEEDTGEETSSINANVQDLNLNTDTNFCQKAIVEVAKQYYYRGKNIIYNNDQIYKGKFYFKYLDKDLNVYKTLNIYTNDDSGTSNFAYKEFSPEDATDDNRFFTACSNFTWQVYNEAFYYDFTDIGEGKISGISSATTAKMMARYKDNTDTNVVPYHHVVSESTDTAAELDKIKAALRVGDIVIIRRSDSTGHAMLYIGDDSSPLEKVDGVQPAAFIESTHKKGTREGTIQETVNSYSKKLVAYDTHGSIYINNASNWFNSNSGYYLFYNNGTRHVSEIIIIRPLSLISDGGACDEDFVKEYDETYSRVTHKGLVANISSSLGRTETVEPGDEITFNITVYNKSNESMKVDVYGDVPTNTELVSGEPVQTGVTIPAGQSIHVSYTVVVEDDESLYRATIENNSNVSDIQLNTLEYIVAGKIDKEKETLINYKASNGEYTNTVDMISDIYRELYSYNGFDRFMDTDNPDEAAANALINSVLKEYDSVETVNNTEYKFKIYSAFDDFAEDLDEELSSMAVDKMYGGYLVSNMNTYDASRRMTDIRVKDLQPGDILSVISYDGTGSKIYDMSSWKKNIYLYLGDSKVAYVEDGSVKTIDITDERPVVKEGNEYREGTPKLIENLHGEVAYTVHRPALNFTRNSEFIVNSPDTLDSINSLAQVLGISMFAIGAYIVVSRKRRLKDLNTI